MLQRKFWAVVVGITLLCPTLNLYAFIGDGGAGWVQVTYLIKILDENFRRYQQLKMMISQAKSSEEYMRLVNSGIENAVGVMNALPVKDERVLGNLRDYKRAYTKVQDVYGEVPKSSDEGMYQIHDETVAEGIKMYNSLNDYVNTQEANALAISRQSEYASPKGAARMNAQVNAQVLHTLNQLLKVNGQILKMGSEYFALTNKNGKESVMAFNKANHDVDNNLNSFKVDFDLTRF